jgi:LysM repeat protein
MKKGVQKLLRRRRTRFVPLFLAALAGLVVLALIILIINFFTSGPGVALFRTATSTPTITATPTLSPTPAPPSPTQPTPTSTNTPGPSPTPAPVNYTVKEGDTLFGISTNFSVPIETIRAANNIPPDSNNITVGQTLIIPQGDIPTSTPSPIPSGLPRGTKIQYKVLLGDSLEIIASKFNSTAEDIATQNRTGNKNLTNADLQAGQVITVRINLVTPTPTSAATATPAVTPTPTNTP